jgi:hypothetical protein
MVAATDRVGVGRRDLHFRLFQYQYDASSAVEGLEDAAGEALVRVAEGTNALAETDGRALPHLGTCRVRLHAGWTGKGAGRALSAR